MRFSKKSGTELDPNSYNRCNGLNNAFSKKEKAKRFRKNLLEINKRNSRNT